jgi:hypothetical protein
MVNDSTTGTYTETFQFTDGGTKDFRTLCITGGEQSITWLCNYQFVLLFPSPPGCSRRFNVSSGGIILYYGQVQGDWAGVQCGPTPDSSGNYKVVLTPIQTSKEVGPFGYTIIPLAYTTTTCIPNGKATVKPIVRATLTTSSLGARG